MGLFLVKPAAQSTREIKNPTTLIGPWVLWVSAKSTQQNSHGFKACGLGDDGNFDCDEMIHCEGCINHDERKASPDAHFSEKLVRGSKRLKLSAYVISCFLADRIHGHIIAGRA
jgi:hypothetical protein